MYKIMIILALSILFQTTLYAEEQRAQSRTDSAKKDSEIITPVVGSQYNLDGMQTRDGQYRSSYSTKSVDNRDLTSNPSPDSYGVHPVVPLIIITDE